MGLSLSSANFAKRSSVHLLSPLRGAHSIPFLTCEALLLGRAESVNPLARKGRAFRRAGLTAKARAEQ
jgi:hypothetical protein